jgi:hypothetical protein
MNTEKTNAFREQVDREAEELAKQLGEKLVDRRPIKPILLQVGDTLRANGCLYRVRKVTPKDVVLRLLGKENQPGVEVPRG